MTRWGCKHIPGAGADQRCQIRWQISLLLGSAVLFVLLLAMAGQGMAKERNLRLSTGEWPPFISEELPGYGFVSEIVKQAFAKVGYEVSLEMYPWRRSIELARAGRVDGSYIWQGTPERAKQFYFSEPVLEHKNCLLIRKDSDFDWQTLADLNGYRIGATRGYAYRPGFRDEVRELGLNLQDSDTDLINLRLLREHRIDIFPVNVETAEYLLSKHFTPEEAGELTCHSKLLSTVPLLLLVPRAHAEGEALVAGFNRGLHLLKESGEWERYMTGWGSNGQAVLPLINSQSRPPSSPSFPNQQDNTQ